MAGDFIRDTLFQIRDYRLTLHAFRDISLGNATDAIDGWLLKQTNKIKGINLADVPPIEFISGKDESAAINELFSRDYRSCEPMQINELEKFHYDTMLGLYGYDKNKVTLTKLSVIDKFNQRRICISVFGHRANGVGVWMLFPEYNNPDIQPSDGLFGNRFLKEVVNDKPLRDPISYMTGPENIILTNGKNEAVSLYKLMKGRRYFIVKPTEVNKLIREKSSPISSRQNSSIELLNIYMTRLLGLDTTGSFLDGDPNEFVNSAIPFVAFFHELGHSWQMPSTNKKLIEKNASYFALRLTRILRQNKIDIVAPIKQKQTVLLLEACLATYTEDFERLSRIRGQLAEE